MYFIGMKFFCIFLFFLLGVRYDFTGAKFVRRFKWSVLVNDNITIFGVRPWKNKLFVTTPTGLFYANLTTSSKVTNPKLTAQYLRATNTHVEVDKCDRLWLYEYKTHFLTIIDLNANKTLKKVQICPPVYWGFTGRIKINVNKTDCAKAYAYLTSEQKIYIYGLKEHTVWERGMSIGVNKSDKNLTFANEHGIGLYSLPTSSPNLGGGIDLLRILQPNAATSEEYLHAVPFDALQKYENRWQKSFRKFVLFASTDTVVGEGRELGYLALHNSTLLFAKHRGTEIWCWNMKKFPHKVTAQKVKKFKRRIYDMRMDEQKTLWVLTFNEQKDTIANRLLKRKKEIAVFTESNMKNMVTGSICDSV